MARMLKRFVRLGLALAVVGLLGSSGSALAQEGKGEAKQLAQGILDKGAALFDTRDASAMAKTYVAGAELHIISRGESSGPFEVQVLHGRDAIREQYVKLFEGDPNAKTTSRNVVTYAQKLGDDMLVIHGHFSPNTDNGDSYPFTQTRIRVDDQWKILQLNLYIVKGAH